MSIEIERKFLVTGDQWRIFTEGKDYRQGYLSTDPERTIRIRTIGEKGYLTIKGKTEKAARDEFEYEIPLEDANWMLERLCKRPLIEKIRYEIRFNEFLWEIDEFKGENEGLIIAEIELTDENQEIELPEWVGKEVTENPVYYNANLVLNPYKTWKNTEG